MLKKIVSAGAALLVVLFTLFSCEAGQSSEKSEESRKIDTELIGKWKCAENGIEITLSSKGRVHSLSYQGESWDFTMGNPYWSVSMENAALLWVDGKSLLFNYDYQDGNWILRDALPPSGLPEKLAEAFGKLNGTYVKQ